MSAKDSIMKKMWTNAHLATMTGTDLGIVNDGLIASVDGVIIYTGPAADAPCFEGLEEIDCGGRWITPGLIDCHTHLVYGGSRAAEFAARLAGASYQEIAKAGGGIISTMHATRAASEAELTEQALRRLDAMIAEGVTTIEIKSGYGLSLESELKMLRVATDLADARNISVTTTFLGAHAVPPEFSGNPDAYVDLICDVMIPAVADEGLADAVDAFSEGIGFSVAQVARIFKTAKKYDFPVKLHAEQLSARAGSLLAAQHDAISADHLEYASEADLAAMAKAGTVAVLLPGAYYFTRETKLPPVERMRDLGVPIALATDCNPGTSPLTSPLLVLNMAATLFRLTVTEALRGITVQAAKALGRSDMIGTLEVGKACDLAIWSIDDPAELVYKIGFNPLYSRIRNGQ
jgi:imidazolonepropionase